MGFPQDAQFASYFYGDGHQYDDQQGAGDKEVEGPVERDAQPCYYHAADGNGFRDGQQHDIDDAPLRQYLGKGEILLYKPGRVINGSPDCQYNDHQHDDNQINHVVRLFEAFLIVEKGADFDKVSQGGIDAHRDQDGKADKNRDPGLLLDQFVFFVSFFYFSSHGYIFTIYGVDCQGF